MRLLDGHSSAEVGSCRLCGAEFEPDDPVVRIHAPDAGREHEYAFYFEQAALPAASLLHRDCYLGADLPQPSLAPTALP